MYACVSSRRTRIHRRTIFYAYVFLRKHLEEGVYQVSAVSASDVLKRNTEQLMMECPVQCGCNAHVESGFFYVKIFFDNVDFQLLLTQILHLNSKRVIIQKKS